MRMLRTYALAAVVVALALGAAVPARAACGQGITTWTGGAQSWAWTDGAGVVYSGGYWPWFEDADKPFSPEAIGIFWAFGSGNPETGQGNDSGTTFMAPTMIEPIGISALYYQDWGVTGTTHYYSASSIVGNWSLPAVDGCVGTNACECVLLQDERGGVGYFAIIAAMTSDGGDLFLNQGGSDGYGNSLPYILKEIPAPDVIRADLNTDTYLAQFEVSVATPTAGVYNSGGCNCGPTGFQIYQAVVPHGAAAPSGRDASQWEAVSGVTPMGAAASYESDACTDTSAAGVDVYLATRLYFDSNFPGGPYKVILSKNNFDEALHCGTNIAEPKPLQPRIRRERPDVPRPQRTR